MLRRVVVFATLLALVTGGAVAYVSAEAADGLVHPARKPADRTPADHDLAYEKVAFEATDGTLLVAWWVPAPDPEAPIVVFLHGYGEGKYQGLPVARVLHDAGYAVLLPDFRAHGESGGDFTTVGLLETRDVAGAVAWAHDRLPCDGGPSKVALVGWSMGGAAALNAAPDLDVAAVVTDSAFADLKTLVGASIQKFTGLPTFPFGALTVFAGERETGVRIADNRPATAAARLEAPLLVVHGTADDVTAPAAAEALHAAQPGAKLLLVQGAGHVSSWDVAPGAYQSALLAFLRTSFEAEAGPPAAGTQQA